MKRDKVNYVGKVESYKISIQKINIEFLYNGNIEVIDFIKRDFIYFESKYRDVADITIEITHNKFYGLDDEINFNTDIKANENEIAYLHCARLRKIWVKYDIRKMLGNKITIYLPEEFTTNKFKNVIVENLIRTFFPNNLFRWQNALMDIIHGSLLGILQLHFIKEGASLIHASAVSNEKSDGFLFSGWSQSGKSTIADVLVRSNRWKFVSEDLCLITDKSKIVGIPKQRRIYTSQMNKENTRDKSAKERKFRGIKNNILSKIFNLIGRQQMRVLSVNEIFDKKQVDLYATLNSSIFILRSHKNRIIIDEINAEKMSLICLNMMNSEMKNFNGFYDLMSIYGIIKGNQNILEKLNYDMFQIYYKCFSNKQCFIMEIPEVESLDFIKTEIEPFIKKLIK